MHVKIISFRVAEFDGKPELRSSCTGGVSDLVQRDYFSEVTASRPVCCLIHVTLVEQDSVLTGLNLETRCFLSLVQTSRIDTIETKSFRKTQT